MLRAAQAPDRERPRGAGSRIAGRGALLRTLRLLVRRVEKFGQFRAATPADRQWSMRLADLLERAWREALDNQARPRVSPRRRRGRASAGRRPNSRHIITRVRRLVAF